MYLWRIISTNFYEQCTEVVCGVAVETSGHALFWCGGAQKVRLDSFFEELKNVPVLDVFQILLSKVNSSELAHFCMITWAIWNNRNSFSNCGISKAPELVVSWAVELLSEFQKFMAALSPFVRPQLLVPTSADWFAPQPGLLKLNTEVAIRKNSKSIGLGAAIRDDKGKLIIVKSRLMHGSFSCETGKFLALRVGLLLAKFYKISMNITEVDSTSVATILNSSNPFLGDAKFIVNDIKVLFVETRICKCQATPKSGNSLALKLALLC
ncbi:hypothetical protein Ddye_010348 [Dipteronia dyeriana]|uniref:RNase H type-1 domain-containing protein n=1 Tax=Dipteronia dyeriana TaxID=168575 RepID=A0AAE0CN72_9ROSI|nr:hypothetical protein Ddye_010348 [Dipteronia dyeriana]